MGKSRCGILVKELSDKTADQVFNSKPGSGDDRDWTLINLLTMMVRGSAQRGDI